jgi:predicted permease
MYTVIVMAAAALLKMLLVMEVNGMETVLTLPLPIPPRLSLQVCVLCV